MHTFDFKNRTAVVTGGAQGFGLDVAKRFLESGAKVFIWDIDEKLLKSIDRYATSSRLTRSAVVREAVKTWIRQKEIDEFEETWIKKLKENPQDIENSEAWLKNEKWGDK